MIPFFKLPAPSVNAHWLRSSSFFYPMVVGLPEPQEICAAAAKIFEYFDPPPGKVFGEILK